MVTQIANMSLSANREASTDIHGRYQRLAGGTPALPEDYKFAQNCN
jgi:hypothetical protein